MTRMGSWRSTILNEFIPGVSKLTLVSDPDNLLTEEKLSLALRARGFDLIEFSDPVEFRYTYESGYRSTRDQGNPADLVVILRRQDVALQSLPYDLLQTGRKLSFNLGKLFPDMSYSVIEKLERRLLDKLFDAQSQLSPGLMGDDATKDFILRHVFGIAVELISNDVDLLRVLLRLHHDQARLSLIFIERLVRTLNEHGGFQTWPLVEMMSDAEAFFTFLQERWPLFLGMQDKAGGVRDNATDHALKYPGPEFLPFDHQDTRSYIENLFIEGKLAPVRAPGRVEKTNPWIRCGIAGTTAGDKAARTLRLFEAIEHNVPNEESRHSDWTAFALKWAELSALVHNTNNCEHQYRHKQASGVLNAVFARWLGGHYASLVHLPPTHPAMLHHVPRRLARDMEDLGNGRLALIVVDGLALDQWVTVRQFLQEQNNNLLMRESATFAWIPTLTPVSRQAIFSGKPPCYFPSSINSTHSEEQLWKQFWENHGFSQLDIAYRRGLGKGDNPDVLEAIIRPGKTRVVGLVVDTIDKVMHGMQLGAAGMHSQVKQWCQKGFLHALVEYLLEREYKVWLTADHGNIECEGKGRPSEGVLAETRGERARIYPTAALRSQVASAFPFAHEWLPVGLPPGYFPLVAGGHDAFARPGDSVVAHGGIAIEEVIVPLVEFERTSR